MEWMAFASLRPFGQRMEDARIARLTASIYTLLAGIFAKKGSRGHSFSPSDFMPKDLADILRKGLQGAPMEQMKNQMMALVTSTGGKRYRHGEQRTRPKARRRPRR